MHLGTSIDSILKHYRFLILAASCDNLVDVTMTVLDRGVRA